MVDCVIRPISLNVCPQRCRTRQLNKITCVQRTETVANCCYINRQINVSLLSTNIVLLWTSFDLMTDRLTRSVTYRLLTKYGLLLQRLCLCYGSGVQSIMEIMVAVNVFLLPT